AEEPQAVLDDRPAQRGKGEEVCPLVLGREDVFKHILICAQHRPRAGIQLRRNERESKVAVPLVAAAFCHDVDHAAGSTAELRLKAAVLDLDLTDEIEWQVIVLVECSRPEVADLLA